MTEFFSFNENEDRASLINLIAILDKMDLIDAEMDEDWRDVVLVRYEDKKSSVTAEVKINGAEYYGVFQCEDAAMLAKYCEGLAYRSFTAEERRMKTKEILSAQKQALKTRVDEILDDYLLTEPDEDEAVITLWFRNGAETQEKQLRFKRDPEEPSQYPG